MAATGTKTGIFYFSGTGNTERVAARLGEALERRNHTVRLSRIDRILKGAEAPDYDSLELLGIGHPVLGFGATDLVIRFAEQLPPGGGKPAFVFKTASSPHYVNHGASESVIRILHRKEYRVFHDSIFAMPCNFFMRYDDRMNKQLDQASIGLADRTADEIARGVSKGLPIHPALSKLLRMVNVMEERGARYWVKGLRATAACRTCGRCSRECPQSNIRMEDGKIRFGPDCIWCMRCVYGCPVEAIEAKRLPSSVVRPYTGGPALDRLARDPHNDGQYVHAKSRGYYRHFIPYFFDRE
ncbi:EFR1 family ferrodoxin [Gorillibacterium sp. sgz5001074]|uniref:EFR1 family ferrodoxin n=1 Tax=Gorillibacterium sp. sgz5001074 TaxID=3446695 RepID=UPI003F666D78